jgi:hypothetical protein
MGRGAMILKTKQPWPASVVSYSTSFPGTENPISESGRWTNGGATGFDWQDPRTTPGKAFGSNTSTGYNDCVGVLAGFPANHSAQVTVYQDPTYTAPDSHEIELLLRFQISANVARGYEVTLGNAGTTIQVFAWHGSIGDVFPELSGSGTGPGGLVTGDVVKAQIVGNVITVDKNGSLIYTVTDSQYSSGNPGMGFFIRPGGTPDRYCISQFAATGL